MRTAHIITRLIIGGAQENTLFNVDDQHHLFGDEVCLITGPGLGPEGTLERQARDRGLDVKILPELCRSLNPQQDWKALGSIRRVLREYAPEIVHTHSSKAGILGRLAAWQLGLPAVHTIHGAAFHYGQHPVLHQAYRLAEWLAANWCDHFITVCDAMTQQYVAAGVASAERFTTVYSGMDVDRFLAHSRPPADVRRELNLSETDVVFGKVGRLFHLKGHNYLIEAAPAVVAEIPNARFILVGDGVLREQYERRIQELGLSSHFRLVGLVAPDAVSDYIHAMDVVVHTSDWEGLPRVVAQGLIAGKPVVTFRLDGAPEVCVDGVTGFLVEHRNVPQLSAAMIRLGTQPDLCRQFGEEGQRRFSGQFRHEFMTGRIREIYREVLERRAARGR